MLHSYSGVHRMRPNRRFLPRHSSRCSGRAHQRTHQLARPRLRSSMIRLMVVVVNQSKSHQQVEESSEVEKPQKPEKSAKVIGLEEPSFLTSNIRLAFTKMGSSRTYNGELLAIVVAFKNSRQYLKVASQS